MNITIRKENTEDFKIIYNLIKNSFKHAEHSDGTEQDLVNRLRTSESYIPDLSLVATINDNIVGYIMFTKITINNENDKYDSLALAPVAVSTDYQGIGIGSILVKTGLLSAKELGYESVVVLGSEKYYPRFGFKEALTFDIKAPFDVPNENFMAIELNKNSLKNVSGTVVYAKEFFE
ncbi:MAG: N-acetyltransferase [Clostridium celatum]|nr:N-acetyltransferase [Clostridium celatum]